MDHSTFSSLCLALADVVFYAVLRPCRAVTRLFCGDDIHSFWKSLAVASSCDWRASNMAALEIQSNLRDNILYHYCRRKRHGMPCRKMGMLSWSRGVPAQMFQLHSMSEQHLWTFGSGTKTKSTTRGTGQVRAPGFPTNANCQEYLHSQFFGRLANIQAIRLK